ncbi:MAG: hypothetical protein H6508_08465 [Calditrichaeota bacterium]|nr:hypothetical protein [Calditrichota bacterium]MCB9367197.1 hypothetical protein [Calditrichota bacterium]
MRVALFLLLICALSAQADVTRQTKTVAKGFGGFESSQTTFFTADKSSDVSKSKWTSGFMKIATGGKEQQGTTITRLDKELVWTLDDRKKTYTEMTFEEFREMLKKATADLQGDEEDVPDTTAEDMYEWKIETLSEPDPKTINGWECRNVRMLATGTNKTDSLDWVKIDFSTWNSEAVPGTAEIREFALNYVKAVGLDEWAQNSGLQMAVALYQTQFKQLAEELAKAPGDAVETVLEIRRHQLVGPSLGKAMKEGMKNEVMGKLPFGKKKEAPSQEPKWEERVKYRMQTDLLSSEVAPVETAQFEVPSGYKKKNK